MAQSDPTVLNAATRFTAKSARSVSVSPSRSPIRKAQFKAHEVDPLLGSLSPDSTLKALSETNAVATAGEQTQDILTQSISEATEQERALGIRAAIAGKKIKEWYTELADWEWPTGLDVGKGKGFENPPGQQDEDYLGCLPVRLLEHYEERVEEIKDGLEALEVEDLKEHVLDAHIPTRSRPTSASGVGAPPPLSFVQLSDFTAVITATIVQALPYLAHLSSMLQTWDFRFLVLRLVPGLLKSLNSTKKALQMAWHSVEDNEEAKSFNRTHFESTKSSLECMVSALGSTFDKALDALEGREDSLPEEWIDLMDSIEMDFANWVVVADKRSFLNEMNQNTLQEAHILVSQCTEIPPGDTPSLANPDDGVEDSIPPQKGECYPNSDLGPGINQDNTNTTETTEYQLETVADAAVKSSVLFEPASNNGSEASVNTSVNINEEPHINEEPNFIKEPNMAEELEPPQAAETMASNLPELTPLTSFRFPPSRAYSKSSSDPRRPEALQIPVSRIGHRRDVSEISVADSMMSDAFSDLSNAEILNASTAEDQCDPSRPSQETTISTNGPFEVQKAYVPQSPVPVQSLGNLSAHAPERPPLLPRKSSRRLPRTLDVALGSVAPDSVTPSTEIATNFTAFPALTTPTKATPASPLTPQSSTKKPVESPTKSTDETIEEKIQDILSGIPARIRLKSPSQPEPSKMPDPNRSSKGSCEKAWLAPIAPSDSSTDPSTRSTTPTPSLTLTPVRPSRSSRPSVSRVDNSDVKVYHLSRSGPNQPKDTPPIRLFVRLVGESGERVMVRVGGGWADLGEYLREYALHHGHSKSSMTNDQFEVQALPDNRKASDGTALGSSPAGSGYLSKSYGTPKQPGSRPSSALDVSRPTPPGLNNHKTRRASAASATIRRDAESPSAMFSSSPASTFSVDPIALDTDKLPPVPIVPSQHDHSRRSFSSAGPVRSATPSQLASSPAMPKFTPLGAAGPRYEPEVFIANTLKVTFISAHNGVF
ncbi:putative gas2 domain protein [Phaeomoniella chlamydospora]|uniref:Putative gas2 domain protein n=1 Tax=Phaeomoniella chlamydospora TaxID=158046 RepID=A0A0G2GZG7_PHACM|nr:putative gas2 domain protein [Phaeomoniella chlamydospora]